MYLAYSLRDLFRILGCLAATATKAAARGMPTTADLANVLDQVGFCGVLSLRADVGILFVNKFFFEMPLPA